MKLLFSTAVLLFCAYVFAQETFPGGIVYGPKAAFKIDAPLGWVLDNQAGVEQGLPCVLYPKGESWAEARTVMYAKIAGTQFEDVDKFVATAIKQMETTHGKPTEKIDKGKTGDGQAFFINEYPRYENVFSMGTRCLHPVAKSRGVYRSLITRRVQLSQRRSGPARGLEDLCLSRAEERGQTALSAWLIPIVAESCPL